MNNRLFSIGLLSALLMVSPASRAAVSFTAGSPNQTAPQNSVAIVPVTVSGFDNVTSFQFTLVWDPGVITFQSLGSTFGVPGLSSANFGNPAADRLTVSWDTFPGVSVANGSTLFSVNYTAVGSIGSQTAISFGTSPVAPEVTQNALLSQFVGIPGSLEVVPEPVNVALSLFACAFLASATYKRRHAILRKAFGSWMK